MSGRILVVDDQRAIAEMMTGVLQGRGYEVLTAFDGETALRQVHAERPDLVVSDILMPGMDGYELCRRVRSDPLTALLPIVLVTSLDPQAERINGLEAGADDFLSKPVNWEELFARVKSLLGVKRLQDEVVSWNMELEGRVRDQVSQLERLSRLKRFFSRQVAEAIIAGGEGILKPHRRDITAVFLDLRGFTAFTDRADPDEVLELLRAYHATLGATVEEFDGTLEHFAGDGMMIIFNDPFPVERPAERAVRMAMALQRAFGPISGAWAKLGHDVGQLRFAAPAFDERGPGEPRAAHAVGGAERDRPAVDVESLVGDADAVAAIQHLHREGLVQLPQVDVADSLAGLLEQLGHRDHRADAHFLRVAAGDREAAEDPERLQAALCRLAAAHHHRRRGAVGELAGVAGGDAAALDRRLDLRYAFVGGVRPDAFVLGGRPLAHRLGAGILVDQLHLGGDRHDLVLEPARRARLCRAPLALHAEAVLLLARDLVAPRDVLRGLQHRPAALGLVAGPPLVVV